MMANEVRLINYDAAIDRYYAEYEKQDIYDGAQDRDWLKKCFDEAPAVDAVSRSVFEQIKWERDCAMQQLKDHGIPFGGIAPAVDAVEVDKAMAWLEGYTMTDTKQIYSNGIVYVPLFRVEQAFVDKAYNGLQEV